jgi:hypothetical protein
VLINRMPRYEILSEEAMATLDGGWRRIVSELGRKTVRDDDPRARVDTRVLEVKERIGAGGTVVEALDEASVAAAADACRKLKKDGISDAPYNSAWGQKWPELSWSLFACWYAEEPCSTVPAPIVRRSVPLS